MNAVRPLGLAAPLCAALTPPRRAKRMAMVVVGAAAGLCLACATACRSSTDGSIDRSTDAATSSTSLGVMAAAPLLLHPPPAGFEPCRDDFSPPSAWKDAQDAYTKLLSSPPTPTLAPLRAVARLKREPITDGKQPPPRLAIHVNGQRLVDLPLGFWAQDIEASPSPPKKMSARAYRVADLHNQLRHTLLPSGGRVAYAQGRTWPANKHVVVHLYAIDDEPDRTARTLGVEGSKLIRILACSGFDGTKHRAAYRVNESKPRGVHRLRLSATRGSEAHPDFTRAFQSTVDLHVLPLGKAHSLVLVCALGGEDKSDPCDDLAKAATSPAK